MDAAETNLLRHHPWVPRRKINVAEYYRMAEAGILAETDRVELIDGELVAISPVGSNHTGVVNVLNILLVIVRSSPSRTRFASTTTGSRNRTSRCSSHVLISTVRHTRVRKMCFWSSRSAMAA